MYSWQDTYQTSNWIFFVRSNLLPPNRFSYSGILIKVLNFAWTWSEFEFENVDSNIPNIAKFWFSLHCIGILTLKASIFNIVKSLEVSIKSVKFQFLHEVHPSFRIIITFKTHFNFAGFFSFGVKAKINRNRRKVRLTSNSNKCK